MSNKLIVSSLGMDFEVIGDKNPIGVLQKKINFKDGEIFQKFTDVDKVAVFPVQKCPKYKMWWVENR